MNIHPILVHLPIGFLVLGVLFSFIGRIKKRTELLEAIPLILKLSSIVSFLSFVSGYWVSVNGEYDETALDRHYWSAIIFIITLGIVAWILPLRLKEKGLWVTALMVGITGHLGGTLTHGSVFISSAKPTVNHPAYQILEKKCVSCHNASKTKGGLRMDDWELFKKGGDSGNVLFGENGKTPELIQRILLPFEDEEHMPPKGRKQLTEAEIEIIENWINEGANIENESERSLPELKSVSPEEIAALQHKEIRYLPKDQSGMYFHIELGKDFKEFPENFNEISDHILGLKAEGIKISPTACQIIQNLKNIRKIHLILCDIEESCKLELMKMNSMEKLNLYGS